MSDAPRELPHLDLPREAAQDLFHRANLQAIQPVTPNDTARVSAQYIAALDWIDELTAQRDEAIRCAFDLRQDLQKLREQNEQLTRDRAGARDNADHYGAALTEIRDGAHPDPAAFAAQVLSIPGRAYAPYTKEIRLG